MESQAGLVVAVRHAHKKRIRLAVTSDLHVDHYAPEVIPLLAEAVRRLEADVLVVAGDLTAEGALLERTLATLRPAARDAVFVPGNHDLWCRPDDADSRRRYEDILPAHARNAGFHAPFADREPPRLAGHRFVGVTGWYDYTLRAVGWDDVLTPSHYERGLYGGLAWNDKRHVRWPGDDGALLTDPALCERQRRSLEGQLVACAGEPVVVVTHHLPFAELTVERGDPRWDFLNGFLGSAKLGETITRAEGVRLAIAGHTHMRRDVEVAGGLRALTSPLGYPREIRRAGQTLDERIAERVTLVTL